jgi:hypothetical protein
MKKTPDDLKQFLWVLGIFVGIMALIFFVVLGTELIDHVINSKK